MRRLDPQDASGISRSIETSVKEVLESEQNRILGRIFSLDNENGALTRMVTQLESTNGKFQGNIDNQLKAAVREFSLDDENSALSRLVSKVEEAKDRITDEFSVDNQDSAINKLNLVLAETRQSIDDNLTLDNEKSALARLRRQLTDVLDDIQTKNQRFQEDVSGKLASLVTRHQKMRSTTHGVSFEDEFCLFLQREAQRAGDVFAATGSKPGAIPKCKTGDAVIEIGSEATAAGERIVFEAKSSKQYSLVDARQEIEESRKNRAASVGVFVFAKNTAPHGLQPFTHADRPRRLCYMGFGRPINRHLPLSRRQRRQSAAVSAEGCREQEQGRRPGYGARVEHPRKAVEGARPDGDMDVHHPVQQRKDRRSNRGDSKGRNRSNSTTEGLPRSI